jgi:hypothetical protein
LRHFDQSIGAVADLDVDLQTKMEIVTLIDDYVFGFSLRAYLAGLEQRVEEEQPGWVQAVFDYMAMELETGAYPNVSDLIAANRAAGGKDEDLSKMAVAEGRFESGLERVLDGIEAELKRRRGR